MPVSMSVALRRKNIVTTFILTNMLACCARLNEFPDNFF